jgi:hypothetical protein
MSTFLSKTRRLLASQLVLLILGLSLCLNAAYSLELEGEIAVWIEPGLAVANSPLSGRREVTLDVQETVLGSGVSGINAGAGDRIEHAGVRRPAGERKRVGVDAYGF